MFVPNSIELVSAERMILHYSDTSTPIPAPTELVSAERMILHYSDTSTPIPAPTDLRRRLPGECHRSINFDVKLDAS